jgi:hypothetical protein
MGELLKEFDSQGQRNDKLIEGTHNKLMMKDAPDRAGISARHSSDFGSSFAFPGSFGGSADFFGRNSRAQCGE